MGSLPLRWPFLGRQLSRSFGRGLHNVTPRPIPLIPILISLSVEMVIAWATARDAP